MKKKLCPSVYFRHVHLEQSLYVYNNSINIIWLTNILNGGSKANAHSPSHLDCIWFTRGRINSLPTPLLPYERYREKISRKKKMEILMARKRHPIQCICVECLYVSTTDEHQKKSTKWQHRVNIELLTAQCIIRAMADRIGRLMNSERSIGILIFSSESFRNPLFFFYAYSMRTQNQI